MRRNKDREVVAMLLAGGQGSRLGALTRRLAKPAVPFGGQYRIIDFTLSNLSNSEINSIGVLTQYQPLELNDYIGHGAAWGLDGCHSTLQILPPYLGQGCGGWYKGTANAVWQNLEFVDQFNPRYVLVVSGDHIYKMDYSAMLRYHKEHNAEVSVAGTEVAWSEAHRFGVMNTFSDSRIREFQEKPAIPRSNLASMGVYIFNWELLRTYLEKDHSDPSSNNDFGKDIIPTMLQQGRRLIAYPFQGYWRDVGTIQSLWAANMDLLTDHPAMDLFDPQWRIYTVTRSHAPHYVAATAQISQSLIGPECRIFGSVDHSVISSGAYVGYDAVVKDAVIMPGAYVGAGARVKRAIVGSNARLGEGCRIDSNDGTDIALIPEGAEVPDYTRLVEAKVS